MAKATALPRIRYAFQYAVKFICMSNIPGTSQRSDSFVPGNYQTAVNIHNPQTKAIKFRQKLASGIGISAFLNGELGPDAVITMTCAQLNQFNLHLIHGFEGFLVIESTHSLDVTAVYTASPHGGQVSGLDIEQIKERKI
jgi:hypothetical protein